MALSRPQELLKERVPQIGRVAILARPQHGDHLERQASEAAACKLGVYPTSRIRHRPFRRASSASLTRFFARLARKVDAMLIFPDSAM